MLLSGRDDGLLSAAVCLLMLSVAFAERSTTCDGSNNVQRLSCDDGVIEVQSALFGRADRQICSDDRFPQQSINTRCSQPGTADLVKKRCNGKRVCEISPDDVDTPDPCYGTSKYLETNYTCVPAIHLVACEFSDAHLFCDGGQVIFVYGADYGRHDQTVCSYTRPASQTQNVYCSNPTSRVAESCNGKKSCTIKASNAVFGDPCPGTYKYLELAYVCQYPDFGPE